MVWDDTSDNHVSSVEDHMEFEGELLTSQPHGLELGASKQWTGSDGGTKPTEA